MSEKASEKSAAVNSVVQALCPLYELAEVDSPRSVSASGPRQRLIVEAQRLLLDLLFPGRSLNDDRSMDPLEPFLQSTLSEAWDLLQAEIERALPYRWQGAVACHEGKQKEVDPREESLCVMEKFSQRLPSIREAVIDDIQAAYDGDPAALTFVEIQICYPGLLAVASHRLAHELYLLQVPIIPRVMSEWTHSKTGVDIHPGARIGRGFFVDHATGVVIGETAVIGNRVKLYQGVTLGAKSFELDEEGFPVKHVRRHPTVEDNVVIYSNATILGGDTVIGAGSTIGGNVFLMESVPANSLVLRGDIGQPRIRENKKS